MTNRQVAWVIPKEIIREKYETLVLDAERIMGLRLTTTKHGLAPQLLTPPQPNSETEFWAKHILALTWPVANVGPGQYANKETTE